MKLICKQLGGSHSYGLNTEKSDIDYRGVFLNEALGDIIGLSRDDHQQNQGNGKDEVYTEFRSALKLLRNANTQMVELLYNDDWIEVGGMWKIVQSHKKELVSSEKLFSCLRGYMQGELRLALGERTGKLGGKRFEQVEKFGFSPKNVVQLIRLAWAGCIYFERGFFPVNVKKVDRPLAEELILLKTKPESFNKDNIKRTAEFWEKKLVKAFENRRESTYFNENLANNLCLIAYGKVINDFYALLPPHNIQ